MKESLSGTIEIVVMVVIAGIGLLVLGVSNKNPTVNPYLKNKARSWPIRHTSRYLFFLIVL